MNRNTITKVALSALVAMAFGCTTEADRDERAKQKIADGANEAQQRLADAEAEYDEQVREAAEARVGEIMRVDAELAEDVAAARNTAEPPDTRGMGTPLVGIGRDLSEPRDTSSPLVLSDAVMPRDATVTTSSGTTLTANPTTDDAAAKTTRLAELEYDRFESVKNEDVPSFCARADSRLNMLVEDYERLYVEARKQTVPSRVTGDLEAAAESIDEARKDLDEVRNATGSRIDDGRVGVGGAINKAQRNLEAVNKALVDLRA